MSPTLSRTLFKISLALLVIAALATIYGGWAAVADDAGPNRLIVPLKVDHAGKAELRYDQGAGLRPEDSATVEVAPADDLKEYVFPVPRVPLLEIRFRPLPDAGQFWLGQPRLESASGRFIAKFPITAIVPVKQIADIHLEGRTWVGATIPGATDPQLTFEVGAPLRVGNPRVPWIEALLVIVFGIATWKFRRNAAAAG
jgi:hypothetical protein